MSAAPVGVYHRGMAKEQSEMKRAVGALAGGVRSGAARLRNALVAALPGERPRWLVLELTGSFPARRKKRRLFSPDALLGKERVVSQEELEAHVTALLAADWLEGVVVRLHELRVGLATGYAVRRQLERLRAGGKRVVVTATMLTDSDLYVASAADELVVPESAEFFVNGMAVTSTYMAEFLDRYGVRVEKLAIREYKSAMENLVRRDMSEGQREQLDALLDSVQRTFLEQVADGRGRDPEEVRAWVDAGVTSAASAQAAGMVDRLAYEDELLGAEHKPFAAGARFLPVPVRPPQPGRVAVVSLEGAIVTGKSRKPPVPLPVFGEAMAGSETLVRALRAAGKDPNTEAVVFHVDSGGGSALASDLIWREVKLLAARLPVVAVMGEVAGSGGYYVLTHATKVVAAPTTITGSIGVLSAKFVMEGFNERYGFNPETLKRGRFADLNSSARGYDDEERALVERYMGEIYERFVARVADGRGLDPERVNEIGRGRIWSGADALELGLVDELGDVASAVALAKRLANLPDDAPVWNVTPPPKHVLPLAQDGEALLRAVAPLLLERGLLMTPFAVKLG